MPVSKKHPAIRRVQPSAKCCFLLYAWPGAGKTRFIGQPGTLILRPPTDHTDSIRIDGVDEWVLNGWEDTYEVEEFLRHNPDAYEWVWLDSISLFQDHGLWEVFEEAVAKNPHRKQGPIDRGEYGISFTRLSAFCRNMVGMPGFNFGITAHPRDTAGEVDADAKLWPWIQGKNMPFKICGYMNIVGYMEVVNQKGKQRRVLRLNETEEYVAKDQYDLTPDGRMVDPSMAKINAALAARKAKPKTTTRRTTRRVGSK